MRAKTGKKKKRSRVQSRRKKYALPHDSWKSHSNQVDLSASPVALTCRILSTGFAPENSASINPNLRIEIPPTIRANQTSSMIASAERARNRFELSGPDRTPRTDEKAPQPRGRSSASGENRGRFGRFERFRRGENDRRAKFGLEVERCGRSSGSGRMGLDWLGGCR